MQVNINAPLAHSIREHASERRSRGDEFAAELYLKIADDPELVALASHVAPGQLPDFLLCAVVHDLLLAYPQGALADCHPLITGKRANVDELFPYFRAFCLDHADEILRQLPQRTVQYTTPLRSNYVLPSLAYVAGIAGEPLALLEIGCSAGFNLLFDQYAYDYGALGQLGERNAELVIPCQLRGSRLQLPTMPRISKRIGLDLNPIDVNDAAACRWLIASTWRAYADQQLYLQTAIALRQRYPLQVIEGDALHTLAPAVAATTGVLCIFHSCCLYQWPAAQLEQLEAILLSISHTRPIHRLAMELPRTRWSAPELARMRKQQQTIPVEITYRYYDHGRSSSDILLARCDGMGQWLEWLV